jgi:hypothetical protein
MRARVREELDWEGKPKRYEITVESDECHSVLWDKTQFSTMITAANWDQMYHARINLF